MRGERARAHRRRSDCFVKVARAPTGGNHAQFGGLESVGASQSRWRHACRGRWPRTRELTAPTQREKKKKKDATPWPIGGGGFNNIYLWN